MLEPGTLPKTPPRKYLDLILGGLAAGYPLAVYFGLQSFEPRWIGLLLITLLVFRHLGKVRSLAASMHGADWLAIGGIGLLAVAIVLFNSQTLLLLYPACISLTMLFIFARTLFFPPSMIERFARLSQPDLSPAGVRYTRRVTVIWCLFFIVNGSVAAASVLATREWWLLYNGFIAYVLMGLLFLGEWLVRRHVMARETSA